MDSEPKAQDTALADVYVLPFKHKHLELLKEMHTARDNALNVELEYADLPKIGFIAFLGKQPVAAGFLRRLEPNHAQLDTFLSNPYFGSQIRHQGMSMVTDALMNEAKDLELKMVIALTKSPDIIARAKEQGFQVVEQTILARKL